MTGYNRDTTSTTDDPRPRPGGLETTAESAQPSGGPPSGPLFHAEELVAGRYRVRRFLGQGAVGEVYAVHDLQLGADVALKALKPGAPSTSPSIERFKREILLARRVSHPNVCRIFDLGVHLLERPGVATEPVLFLTMELLDGRTLVRRIEEGGPYAEAEAVPVIRQLAEGLAAAHRAGVVHRDFKSSNVVLVPGPAGERAVITDFGLAREQDVPSGSGLTATGGVLGTPAYMAPEQVEGRRATPRSDLYAFGVVIYEMMSGELPFEGESPLSVAVQRLQHDPIPLESRRSGLSHRMRAIVRRLLERDADDRFAEALEVSRALEGEVPAASPRRRRRRRRLLAAAIAAAAVALTAWLGVGRLPPRSGAPATHAERRAVAVLALRNATGRPDVAWLSAALAEMLSTELGSGDELRSVPGETVARAVSDLALTPADSLAGKTLERLRGALGADWVVLGSFTALSGQAGGPLRLDLRLQRTDGSRDLPLSTEGSEGQLFDLVARAGRELRRALGVPEPAGGGPARTRAALPGSEEAVRLYSEGLEKLRAGDPLAARERLEAAIQADPEAPLAWSALARAWSDLGYSEHALEAARTAWQKSSRLPRGDALSVEARYRLANHEWEAAIDDFRALWRFYPDDLEAGLALVDALVQAERGTEALTTIKELRALPAPARDDPRIDLAAARAADGVSDFRSALAAARRAQRTAEALGAKSLVARAEYEQGLALRKLGDADGSRAALLGARRLSAEAGDRSGVALVLMALANLERGQGRLDEAGALFAEARTTFAAIGNRDREARAELSQGLVISAQGDIAGAVRLYEDALGKLRESGDRRGAAVALANIGTMRYELGDLAGALARHTEALEEFRALGDEARVVIALENISQYRLDGGDLAGAAPPLEEALSIARRLGDRAGEGYSLKALGDLAAERGEIGTAEKRYAEASAVFRGAGMEPWLRLTRLAQAGFDLQRGRAAQAERALAALVPELAAAGAAGDRDEAAVWRLRALAALGRPAEAEALEPGLLERAARSDSRRLRHLARLAQAELDLATGRAAAAKTPLDADLEEAKQAGFALQALETRALQARVAAALGDPGAARMAEEVAAEAARVGSGRIRAQLGAAAAPGAKGATPGV